MEKPVHSFNSLFLVEVEKQPFYTKPTAWASQVRYPFALASQFLG